MITDGKQEIGRKKNVEWNSDSREMEPLAVWHVFRVSSRENKISTFPLRVGSFEVTHLHESD